MAAESSEEFPRFEVTELRGDGATRATSDAEWERVFSHFQPRLLSYFKRKADGVLPLDDLLQELWMRAFLNVSSLDSERALWSWLVTIGNNLLRDELRRNRPRLEDIPISDDALADEIAEFVGVTPVDPEARDDLQELRAKLSDEEWELLNLLCVDNLSHEEAAQRLGMPTAMASRQRLRRVRQRLLG